MKLVVWLVDLNKVVAAQMWAQYNSLLEPVAPTPIRKGMWYRLMGYVWEAA
jgi:hypothetical protein